MISLFDLIFKLSFRKTCLSRWVFLNFKRATSVLDYKNIIIRVNFIIKKVKDSFKKYM